MDLRLSAGSFSFQKIVFKESLSNINLNSDHDPTYRASYAFRNCRDEIWAACEIYSELHCWEHFINNETCAKHVDNISSENKKNVPPILPPKGMKTNSEIRRRYAVDGQQREVPFDKKDYCTLCLSHRKADEKRKLEFEDAYNNHTAEKISVRRKKQEAKETSKLNPSVLAVAVFDLQQIIQLPKSKESALFFRRRISSINFTVYNIGNKECSYFFWDETISKRGASEISTCVARYLNELDNRGIKEVRISLLILSSVRCQDVYNVEVGAGAFWKPLPDTITYEATIPLTYESLWEEEILEEPIPFSTPCYGTERPDHCNVMRGINEFFSTFTNEFRLLQEGSKTTAFTRANKVRVRGRRALNFVGDAFNWCCGVATQEKLDLVSRDEGLVWERMSVINKGLVEGLKAIVQNSFPGLSVTEAFKKTEAKIKSIEKVEKFKKFSNVGGKSFRVLLAR
ncbi:unnamed protein product [Ceutorhynchus assimilis]|uniref:Uncharacterized protein n=1 Tax=Ceutorhynchus assimilis TaxID=467358 RepID=A0A9N9MD73_9CUCU|nr:unnamed protein product [Ceutorhynchus assimilis]